MTVRWMAAPLLGLAIVGALAHAQVDEAVDTVEQTNRADAASQNRIDELSAETREMLEAYRRAITRKQQLAVYNRELEKIVGEQERRRDALAERVDSVSDLREEIEPLMLRMIDNLDRFIEADLPFRKAERDRRVAGLREAVADPEQNIAERFRKVLAAYQAEAEYGRTLGTYRGELDIDGNKRLVEFLRIGRVMLFYITPDDARVGYWDRAGQSWKPLPDSYRGTIRDGVRVAKDLAAPQLVEIAVPAPGSDMAGGSLPEPDTAPPGGDAADDDGAGESGGEEQS